ncbi:MAG: ATP-dependent helicase HrpB [Chthoniobacterales bacterium]
MHPPNLMTMLPLPIDEIRQDLIAALRDNRRILLQAPTGSGKSTRIPQFLLECEPETEGEIVVLQPRRLPARMLAARVASERGCRLGDEVGYQIRFDKVVSSKTKIRFVTEGILLREIIGNPRLKGIRAIVFDEFHERHLYTDLTLGRVLRIQKESRPDLIVIVMSATLDSDAVEKYLSPCTRLDTSGRVYPVSIQYQERAQEDRPVWEVAGETVERHWKDTTGNILVFMPGRHEIQRTIRELQRRIGNEATILPLHGELSVSDQDSAVNPSMGRRIIVSTNVAETSLTIDGITMVVDSGLARVARHDPRRGINTLYIEKISHASADQRAGRAGRTAPGICLRMWTKRDHELRPQIETPEILRVDLCETVLYLKASGENAVEDFPWITPPLPLAIQHATQILTDLDALAAESGTITATGKEMTGYPVHPRYARMMIAAQKYRCGHAAAFASAIVQSRNLLLGKVDSEVRKRREDLFENATSDFARLSRAFRFAEDNQFKIEACRSLGIHADTARQVQRAYQEFLKLSAARGTSEESEEVTSDELAKCVLAAFADNVAIRRDRGTLSCDLVHGRRGLLNKESAAADSALFVAAEIDEIQHHAGEVEVRLSLATPLEKAWLAEVHPTHLHTVTRYDYDSGQRRVIVKTETLFRDLVIESSRSDARPSTDASACLAGEVVSGNLDLPEWNESVEEWISRVNWLARNFPDYGISPIGKEETELLYFQLCEGIVTARELRTRPVLPVIRAWLSSAQQQLLEQMAPERLVLPNGRKARIRYPESGEPVISARIQDLYGVESSLHLGKSQTALTIEVLGPNHRPLQTTRDLRTFWKETYPKLKSELQRKYPRHEWR